MRNFCLNVWCVELVLLSTCNNENENVQAQTMRHYYCCCRWKKFVLLFANCEIWIYRSLSHTQTHARTHLSILLLSLACQATKSFRSLSASTFYPCSVAKRQMDCDTGVVKLSFLWSTNPPLFFVIAKLLADFHIIWIIRPQAARANV